MVRTTEADDRTAAENAAVAADRYASNPNAQAFASLRGAVEDEYADLGRHGPAGDGDFYLGVVAAAVKDAADALGYDVKTMINFDDRDEVTIEWPYGAVEPGTVPTDLAALVAQADTNAGPREVVFRADGDDRTVVVEVERGTPDDA